jgi:two-component system KDP operon response regulator KdpE
VINLPVLLARLRVVERHKCFTVESSVSGSGEFEVDLVARIIKSKSHEVGLTLTEYSLLSLFTQHHRRMLQHILRKVWGTNYLEHTDCLRVHIAHLRHKLEPDSSRSSYLKTEAGVGYRVGEKVLPGAH